MKEREPDIVIERTLDKYIHIHIFFKQFLFAVGFFLFNKKQNGVCSGKREREREAGIKQILLLFLKKIKKGS